MNRTSFWYSVVEAFSEGGGDSDNELDEEERHSIFDLSNRELKEFRLETFIRTELRNEG